MRKLTLTAVLLLGSAMLAGVASARDVQPLANGWRFQFGTQPDAAAAPGFDDAGWQQVGLPHTWNRIGEYSLKRSGKTDNRQGTGWYRLALDAPAAARGKRFYLDFGAVGAIADVWVNGKPVGHHAGAFSRFRLDVTDAWVPGKRNVIAVRADNSKPAIGSSTQEVIPLGGDFFVHGGLYRGVSLITADEAGVDLLDMGGPGVYARSTGVADGKADVAVTTRLRNAGKRPHTLAGTVTINDAAGQAVASASFTRKLAAGATDAVALPLSLANPQLWDGRRNPYLYTVTVNLSEAGKPVDSVTQPLGIRSFRFDADKGFFLNGRHVPLVGVSRHQDRLGQGWALTPADHVEDMAIIADMGANTVRMAHYQHDDAWADAADRAGMVAWAEIPFVNAASLIDGAEASPALKANAEQQLKELIRQNYNHPSIVTWSVGNEVDIGAVFAGGKFPAKSLSLLKHLNSVSHAEDPSRPTSFADCCEKGLQAGMKPGELLAGATDLIGYNRYFGWYYATPAQLGPALDDFHAIHPGLPLSVSEFGAGGALTQHSDNPLGGPINAFGRPHPEEYQSWYHEQSWQQLRTRPFVFASWVWNMFDFASDLRDEGDATDINDKGLVSFDRKVKKDAFYFYKAQLSDQPVLHINGRRYVDRAYPVTDVRVYSNAPQVALFLNGQPLGTRACPDHVCVWPAVALAPGANKLLATATIGSASLTDSLEWQAPDARAGLHIDAGDLSGHVGPAGRYGSDTFFTGGAAKLLNVAVLRGRPATARREVTGAADPVLFNTWREGDASWALPLPNGRSRVTLHSFEPEAGGTRSFAVRANGQTVDAGFSPAAAAGGALKAAARSFDVTVSNGMLQLAVAAGTGAPVVAAIDVVPAP